MPGAGSPTAIEMPSVRRALSKAAIVASSGRVRKPSHAQATCLRGHEQR
jgi:hypothetical protein